MRVGIIGSGYISTAYLKSNFPQFKVVSCGDLMPENAETRAREFGIRPASIESILTDPDTDIILNLTNPQSHVAVSLAAIDAGKHVYSEKPLGLTREEAQPLLGAAAVSGLRIGCAPDTFLGGGHQTARKLVDDGAIGKPIGGAAFFMSSGPESWHPNPEFLYRKGAGPVFDMGPYYVTALVNLLGPVRRVVSSGKNTTPKRTIGSGPRKGAEFDVEVLTFIAAILEFSSGPLVTFVSTFDVAGHQHPPIEIYGTEGTLQAPDPNYFGGAVRVIQQGGRWKDIAHSHSFGDANHRGIGLADMSASISSGADHRASGTLAFHVLEVLQAIVEIANGNSTFEIYSTCNKPKPLTPITPIPDFS